MSWATQRKSSVCSSAIFRIMVSGMTLAAFDNAPRRYPATVVRASANWHDPKWPYELALEFDEPAPELEPLLQYVI